MNESIQITLELEGLPKEGGHVRLSDFVERLTALKDSIDVIDRVVTKERTTTLYYRIVGMSHSSPVNVVLEPVKKAAKKHRDSAVLVQQTHHRFFEEFHRLENGQAPSDDIRGKDLDAFKRLVSNREGKFSRFVIKNGSETVDVTNALEKSVTKYTEHDSCSFGTLEGMLESVNLHGEKKNFWIYPFSGPNKVNCKLPKILIEKVRTGLDQRVRVTGKKLYRENQNFPYMIEATELEPIENPTQDEHFLLAGGVVGSGETDSVTLVRESKDEW